MKRHEAVKGKAASRPIIKTNSVEILLYKVLMFGLEKNRTFQWLGIPYAQAPVGSLRWKAPRSLENENDQVKAIEFSNHCQQVESISIDKKGEGEFLGSEDCLFLNIFAPKNISSDKKLPVIFWIHGGGNTSGEAGSYDFSKLAAAHDLVIVSINYRLGFLGWFYHPYTWHCFRH